MDNKNSITLIAPAKINLFLSVTGKKDNGYHNLQSLIAFADFGDTITITPADEFSLSFDSTSENLPTNGNNLVICAANLLAQTLGKNLSLTIHLSKNIPIGAGLGGGSSDAATTIKGLLKFWDIALPNNQLNPLLLELGADVPSCYHQQACYFEGIGEKITPINKFHALHAILIYPNEHCATQNIFKNYQPTFSKIIPLPPSFEKQETLIDFLKEQKNDLTSASMQEIPLIKEILHSLNKQQKCLLARMSGSGSACFGLFETREEAKRAAHHLQHQHPNWWVRDATLS